MAATGKQIAGVSGQASVGKLAQAAIEQRLAVVVENFPAAAQGKIEDHEPVHQLRVSTRRAVAALRLFEAYCPPRHTRKLQKLLKRIRRTASAARDLDVFSHRLSKTAIEIHQLLASDLVPERDEAQSKIVKLYEKLHKGNRLARRIDAVTDRIKPRGKLAKRQSDKSIDAWAPKQLRRAANRVLAAIPDALDEPEELHSLRIEGKRVRYKLELLAAGIPAETYDSLYRLFEELQDRLGAVNDHLVAMERLDNHVATDRIAVERAIENERTGMEQAIAEFRPWFFEKFLPEFKSAIEHEPQADETHEPTVASA